MVEEARATVSIMGPPRTGERRLRQLLGHPNKCLHGRLGSNRPRSLLHHDFVGIGDVCPAGTWRRPYPQKTGPNRPRWALRYNESAAP